ncbi:MAG TPA: hypothetical protein VEX68_14355 [Bryobacteraceae bacterium]|nr:hypothetical protein [Bryobacteraceae bacterium]
MRSRLVLAIAALLSIGAADAQEKKEGETSQYKVEFHIQDSADTAKSARRYSMLIDANSKGTFRVGNRVPYTTGTPTAQYQYADVGVNIDTRLREVGSRVGLNADLELSGIVQSDKTVGATVNPNPTISSFRITINAVVAPGKRIQVASVDDPTTMRRFEVDATITRTN